MAHKNQRLLESVAYGTSYGTGYKTDIKQLKSGSESRNALWSLPKGRFAILYKLLKETDHEKVVSAFHVCKGRLHTFRFKDKSDYIVSNSPIGTATGNLQQLQLSKRYTFAGDFTDIPVYLPNVETVILKADGVQIEYSVDALTGIVEFTAAPGSIITWSGEFDKKVRFDDDELDFSIDVREGGIYARLSANVELKEVRE